MLNVCVTSTALERAFEFRDCDQPYLAMLNAEAGLACDPAQDTLRTSFGPVPALASPGPAWFARVAPPQAGPGWAWTGPKPGRN